MLLDDQDDMVQKGLGWLLRESAKFNARQTVPLLMKIRTARRVWSADGVRDALHHQNGREFWASPPKRSRLRVVAQRAARSM